MIVFGVAQCNPGPASGFGNPAQEVQASTAPGGLSREMQPPSHCGYIVSLNDALNAKGGREIPNELRVSIGILAAKTMVQMRGK